MVEQKTKVVNKEGFHMRPANNFIKEMAKFKSTITFDIDGKEVNAKSIMNIMAACIKFGTELTVKCDGPDEQEALDEAVGLIESGLGDPE